MTSTSSGDGVGSPDGWLCVATMAAAFASSAALNTSRGLTSDGIERAAADLVVRDHAILRRQAQDREHLRRVRPAAASSAPMPPPDGRPSARPTINRLAIVILSDRISYRQLSKSHRLRLHWRVLRVCVLWFLRDLGTRQAQREDTSGAPPRRGSGSLQRL